jgi:hypothetical protein
MSSSPCRIDGFNAAVYRFDTAWTSNTGGVDGAGGLGSGAPAFERCTSRTYLRRRAPSVVATPMPYASTTLLAGANWTAR